MKTLLLFPVFALALAGCQTSYEIGTAKYGPADISLNETPDNNAEGYVPASDFLEAGLMKGDLHEVAPQAWNDGYTNTYKIQTEDHVHYVQGTQNARKRIHEIEATETLRKLHIVESAGLTVADRGANLIATPIRAVSGGMERSADVENANDAFLVFRSGIVDVLGNLAGGIKELGVTGVRITTGAAGTRCSGVGQCFGNAGRDVWSGVNSITGKHDAARRVHQSVGTDPYSDNKVLQNQVDRLAYTNAYTGLGFKFGLAGAGIPVLSPYVKGVGYYNNVEFVSQYEDAEKRRKIEKELLLNDWDVPQETIDQFYGNENFNNTTRSLLLQALAKLTNLDARADALADASDSQTRYVAENKVMIFQYIATLSEEDILDGFVEGSSGTIPVTKTGAMLLPFAGDYISWTDEIAAPIANFAALIQPEQSFTTGEIHVLGLTSPLFKEKAEALGLKVVEIDPSI